MIGLDDTDKRIIRTLKHKERNISGIATATQLSHSTVSYRLKRMQKHRLVEEVSARGMQRVWTLSKRTTHSVKDIRIYQHDDYFQANFALPREVRKKTIVYTIEGTDYSRRNAKQAIYRALAAHAHQVYSRKHIVIKSVAHTDVASFFIRQGLSLEALAARKRHPTVVRLLPHTSLLGPCVYAFMPHCTLMQNEARKHAVVIKDEKMARVLYDMIALLYDLLEYADNVEHLEIKPLVDRLLAKLKR